MRRSWALGRTTWWGRTEEARVTVYRTFTDGTSITRETVFVWNDTYWSHHLTEEEKDIFMPGVPYEEFVEAQEG